MEEIIHNSKGDQEEDIDRILASGNSMDEQTMSRVLSRITMSLALQMKDGSVRDATFASWFFRLRQFDEKAFERLVLDWLVSLLSQPSERFVLRRAVSIVVGSGSLAMDTYAKSAGKFVSMFAKQNKGPAALMSLELLGNMLPNQSVDTPIETPEAYRFRLQQRKCVENFEDRMLPQL
ncbi:hypothetical protein LTS18_002393, partial [Coniosporium uncinatum]